MTIRSQCAVPLLGRFGTSSALYPWRPVNQIRTLERIPSLWRPPSQNPLSLTDVSTRHISTTRTNFDLDSALSMEHPKCREACDSLSRAAPEVAANRGRWTMASLLHDSPTRVAQGSDERTPREHAPQRALKHSRRDRSPPAKSDDRFVWRRGGRVWSVFAKTRSANTHR